MGWFKQSAVAKLSLLCAATAAVCFGQPDLSNPAAKAIELTGQVSVLKDGTAWALDRGDMVLAKQLIITGPDGQAKFQVSDGSTFDVYPNSRVVFRKNAPNWMDLLDVLVGRVKVHIQHLYGPNPNRVVTPTAVISVRGTTFDITVGDADETTEVAVEEGIVEVRHAMLPGTTKTLTAGESVLVYRNVPIASSRFDKGMVAQRVLRMVVDAVSTWESRIPRGASTTGTGPTSCDCGTGTGAKTPPPPPPPAPPPPVPPPVTGGHFASAENSELYANSDQPLKVLVVRQHHSRWYAFGQAMLRQLHDFALGPTPGIEILRTIR